MTLYRLPTLAASMLVVLAVMSHVPQALSRAAKTKALVAWELDGKPITVDNAFEIRTGRLHVLRAKLLESVETVVVTVIKTLPDGHRDRLEKNLDTDTREIDFELGPFTAPAVYEFEAGVVYHRGYRLQLVAKGAEVDAPAERLRFYQGLAEHAGMERFVPGEEDRSVFIYSAVWKGDFGRELAVSMFPPFALKLDPAVLVDQDKLKVEYAARLTEPAQSVTCVLRVMGSTGEELFRREVTAKAKPSAKDKNWYGLQPDWQSVSVDPSAWPAGDYRIDLWPKIGGKLWREGPSVIYHRREIDPLDLAISPYVPWRLRRDPARPVVRWNDMREAHTKCGCGQLDAAYWEFRGEGARSELIHKGDEKPPPVVFEPKLQGFYAVFALPHRGCFVQIGREGLIRRGCGISAPATNDTFVAAADLTDEPIKLYGGEQGERGGLASLRFVPVTAESVKSLYREMGHPPTPLYGICDWWCYFDHTHDFLHRYEPDQFDTLIGAQAELGMRTIDWAIGRSWIQYHTDLENTTRFPCLSFEEACKRHPEFVKWRGRVVMTNKYCPLVSVYAARGRFGVEIWPWLAMQQHYSTKAYGGLYSSKFYREHPKWWRWSKAASAPQEGAMCYYFPEVCKERVDILLDVARKGAADGILVGCCRQVPMLLYHRKMVAEYQAKTGVDPLKIDASAEQPYRDWITWRADFFTQVLRDLRKGLAAIEKEQGRKIPVAVRIPSAGLFYNLTQGLAVERWCKEKLVDVLYVEPLEDSHGRGSHDIRPYIELRRRYGVDIIAGIGPAWWNSPGFIPSLKRARGLLAAKPDGIENFETELLARSSQHRWILPLFGNPARIDETLGETNLEACYPVQRTSVLRWERGSVRSKTPPSRLPMPLAGR